MNAETYFHSIRKAQGEIRRLEEIIKCKHLQLLPGAIRYDKDNVQTSPEDSMSQAVADIATMETKVRELDSLLKNRMFVALCYTSRLTDPDERQVVMLYYLTYKDGHLMSWEEVAGEMGFTDRHAKRVRNRAMYHIDTMLRQTGTEL